MGISTIDPTRRYTGWSRILGTARVPKKGIIILSLLIGADCFLFLLGMLFPALREALMLRSPAVPTPPLATAFLNWRAMASYTFVHSGPMHLIFNMAFLWILGCNIIRLEGIKKMLICYVAGAAAGGLGFLIVGAFFPEGKELLLCGASAAVLALSGAILASDAARNLRLTAWAIAILSIIGSPVLPAFITHICGFIAGYCCAKAPFSAFR